MLIYTYILFIHTNIAYDDLYFASTASHISVHTYKQAIYVCNIYIYKYISSDIYTHDSNKTKPDTRLPTKDRHNK